MNSDYDQQFPTRNTVAATGTFRQRPEDFQVDEISDFDLSGEGEHLWLHIRKTGCNTDWVASELAKACGVPPRQVGYAGLKDRHAVTTQWFSVQLPQVDQPEPIQASLSEGIEVREVRRHHKKLKTGGLRGNAFRIKVRDISGDREQIETNIQQVSRDGIPNYFGRQRFGHELGNVQKASDWFAGTFRPRNRKLKSLLISTARSWIFNHILSYRIQSEQWLAPLDGDIYQLDGSHSWFLPDAKENDPEEIQRRLQEKDIHITAALWGEDEVQTTGEAALLEQAIAGRFPELTDGLIQHRVKQDRRSVRLRVDGLSAVWDNDDLILTFELTAGGYATSVLREIIAV